MITCFVGEYIFFFKRNKTLGFNRITRYTPDLPQNQVDATIAQAFQIYSDVIPLDFKQVYRGNADIMILFQGGREFETSRRLKL